MHGRDDLRRMCRQMFRHMKKSTPSLVAMMSATGSHKQSTTQKRMKLVKPKVYEFVNILPKVNMDNTLHKNGLAYILNCQSHPSFTSHRRLQSYIHDELTKASGDKDFLACIEWQEGPELIKKQARVASIEQMYKLHGDTLHRTWKLPDPGFGLVEEYRDYSATRMQEVAVRDFLGGDFVRYDSA